LIEDDHSDSDQRQKQITGASLHCSASTQRSQSVGCAALLPTASR
jgi:hypothetical protein